MLHNKECDALTTQVEGLKSAVAEAVAREKDREADPNKPMYSQAEFDAVGEKKFSEGAASQAKENENTVDVEAAAAMAAAAAQSATEATIKEFEEKLKVQEERMTKEMRVLLMANDALKAEKVALAELKNKELQECVEIIEQLDAEKKAVEKKQSAFDEKYDLSQSLLAKRNDQLKDFEAALLAAKQQKESIRVDLESKCKEIADMKEGVLQLKRKLQKETEMAAKLSSWRQPKKMHLFQRKSTKGLKRSQRAAGSFWKRSLRSVKASVGVQQKQTRLRQRSES